MADKKIQMTQRNAGNTAWDNLYPKTTGDQVVASDGTTFESHLAEISTQAAANKIPRALGTGKLDPSWLPTIGVKNNFVATVAPTATDDISKEYVKGSMWLNTATNICYMCIDNTLNTAKWAVLEKLVGEVFYNYGIESTTFGIGKSTGTGSQSKTSDHLELVTKGDGTSGGIRTYVTGSKITLFAGDILKIDWSFIGDNTTNQYAYLKITNDANGVDGTIVQAVTLQKPTGDHLISSMTVTSTGDYYISAFANVAYNDTNNLTIKVYKIWKE